MLELEPELLPVGNVVVDSSNTAERARLDVSAVGIWSPHSCSTTSIMGHLFFLEGHRKRQKFLNHALLFLQQLSSRVIFLDAVKSIRKLD